MEKLKRLIGSAPSELSPEELLRKIQVRQTLIAGTLQEFRERMEGSRARAEPKAKKVSETLDLKKLMEQMKERGLNAEDFRKIARGGKEK